MAGAIALDLRGGGEENVFAIAFLCCNRSLHSHLVFFIRLFVTHHLGCIVLHAVHTYRPTPEHPWLRCRLPGRGVFLTGTVNITYQLYIHRLMYIGSMYGIAYWLK